MKRFLTKSLFVFLFCASVSAQSQTQQCPVIEISGPDSLVKPGETFSFSASFKNEFDRRNLKYKWTVDKGTIIEGQGTLFIKISTDDLENVALHGRLEIEGLPENCPNSVEESVIISTGIADPTPIDQFSRLSFKNEKMRIDNLFIQLSNMPESKAYYVITMDKKEKIADINQHLRKIVRFIKYRKFDLTKITFAIDNGDYHSTELHILPESLEFPFCKNCKIIKGTDVR